MTPTTILRVDFREIPCVEITCSKCSAAVSLPLPQDNIPRHFPCPGCNSQLWGDGQEKVYSAVLGLVRSVSHWKRMEHEAFNLGFSLKG